MRRAPARASILLLAVGSLTGCAGFGGFVAHTFDPVHRPYEVASNSTQNVALSHGLQAAGADMRPAPGQPWPTSYPMDPTIISIEKSGVGVP